MKSVRQDSLLDFARSSLEANAEVQVVCNNVIVCKHADGMYSIHIPYITYSDEDIDFKRELAVLFTNVETFITKEVMLKDNYSKSVSYDYFMLVKVKMSSDSGYWTLFRPSDPSFICNLTQDDCNKRVANLPKLYYIGKSQAEFVEGFDNNLPSHYVFMRKDDDLFIVDCSQNYYSETNSTAYVSLKKIDAKVEPTNFNWVFKLTDSSSESLCATSSAKNGFFSAKFGPYYAIKPMPENFYPFLNSSYSGVIANDKDGNICGIYIKRKFDEWNNYYSYSFAFDKPVSNIQFCKRITNGKTLKNGFPDIIIDVWKVTNLDGTKKFLFQVSGNTHISFELDYSDLINF